MSDLIKCRIYKGAKFEEDGRIKFLNNNKVDNGYEDYYNKQDFEKQIKALSLSLGMFVDAFDEKGKIFWSNYREIEEVSELDQLRQKYKELSGEEAKGNWGVRKLTDEINKLIGD